MIFDYDSNTFMLPFPQRLRSINDAPSIQGYRRPSRPLPILPESPLAAEFARTDAVAAGLAPARLIGSAAADAVPAPRTVAAVGLEPAGTSFLAALVASMLAPAPSRIGRLLLASSLGSTAAAWPSCSSDIVHAATCAPRCRRG